MARIVITAAHVARDQARPREEWRRAWRLPARGSGVRQGAIARLAGR